MDDRRPEFAEAVGFSRANVANLVGVPQSRLNNWIDRNQLWQTGDGLSLRSHYRLRHVFDLAGFAAMRVAYVPETKCAMFTRNFGFYRKFLSGDQLAEFSYRNDDWDIGVYDPSAIVALIVNMRTVGCDIFARLARELSQNPESEIFQNFKSLYQEFVKLDRLPSGVASEFERVSV